IMQSGILSQQHDIEVLDANVLQLSFEESYKRIFQSDPDVILFLTSTQSRSNDIEFMRKIKEKKKDIILIGSGNYLFFEIRESMEEYGFIDAVLLGFTYDDILKYLQNDFDKIEHMAFRKDNEIIIKNKRGSQVFEIPVPRHELFPINKYRLPYTGKGITTVTASQGCPFQCSYCYGGNIGYRRRPVENVMAELRHISSLGIKEVFFKDFEFPVSRQFVVELCNKLIDEDLKLSWVCLARATDLDDELLGIMGKAGCHTIQLGVESGDDELLERYKKGVTTEQIRNAVSLCKKHRIRVLAHFIIGLPGETRESALKTIEFSKELDTDYAAFNIAIPILGSRLREEAITKGWASTEQLRESDSSLAYPLMATGGLSKEEVWQLRNKAIREFYLRPKYILRRILELRSLGQLSGLVTNGFSVLRSTIRA
ncbi:MAG: radical SAM protein, partial [Candidatus Micrarchaeota archaeon]